MAPRTVPDDEGREGTGVPSEGSRSQGRGPVLVKWEECPVRRVAGPGGPGQHRLWKGLERRAEGHRPMLLPGRSGLGWGGRRTPQDTREPLKRRLLDLGEWIEDPSDIRTSPAHKKEED